MSDHAFTLSRTGSSTDSIPLTMILCLFVGLKLTGQIEWSWWWVLSPLWIPASFLALLIPVYFYLRSKQSPAKRIASDLEKMRKGL